MQGARGPGCCGMPPLSLASAPSVCTIQPTQAVAFRGAVHLASMNVPRLIHEV